MPRVPTYESRVRATGLPSARRQAQPTSQSEGSGVGEAIAGLGATIGRTGQTFAQILEEQYRKADETALLTADRQGEQLVYNLVDAPDVGVLVTMRGKAALGAREAVMPKFDQQMGMIEMNLNPRQREVFQLRRFGLRQKLLNRLNAHANAEMAAYRRGEAEASLETALNVAVANADDAYVVAEQLAKGDTIYDTFAVDMGIVGPEARKASADGWRSKVHEGVIAGLLAKGMDLRARVYFQEARGQIDASALPKLEAMVTEASSAIAALRAADEIWNAHAPAGDNSAIEIDKMEAAARAKFAEDPTTLKATIAELRSRLQGVEAGRKQRDDSRDDALWTSIMQGTSLASVMQSRAFLESTGPVKNRVVEYYRRAAEHAESLAASRASRAAAAENHAYTAEIRAERRRELAGWSEYYRLVQDPKALAAMSRADIVKRLPELGHDHVGRLLNEQEQLQRSEAAVRSATIDDSIFKDVARGAGLDYVDKTPGQQTEAQRANLGSLKAAVLGEIARRQQATGKPLQLEEKRTLMAELVDNRVMLDTWFSDEEVIGAMVNPDDRRRAYVPLDKINRDDGAYKSAINYLRGLNANAATMPEPQLRALYRSRIEKALGRARIGGTRQEIENALNGVD